MKPIGLIVVLLLATAACSPASALPTPAPPSTPAPSPTPAPSASPASYELVGTFTLREQSAGAIDRPLVTDANGVYMPGPTCTGRDGYSDFGPGMPVTVKDETGEVIATSTTVYGPPNTAGNSMSVADSYSCEVDFTVSGLPAAKFYTISIGKRGDVTKSFDELAASNWRVALSLGAK